MCASMCECMIWMHLRINVTNNALEFGSNAGMRMSDSYEVEAELGSRDLERIVE
ncbi:hypothetical protein HanRHA438_Chr08g0370011 [Helianthus annuus]|nr:hypothetical protein HanHA300_Chr08g0295551 [Helianthus annuus]KAJ0554947.1 hypothetical protein HanHA89_Chr08g0314061 [Helianthus annuus]KAJ0720514.1 hypothetical protein HanLR1_Chr08g0294411 [Helianthus annuus]KAJ0899564.1 hypothetical protein HanRHA438_Chr08g0370011 [Helianthus annuus]